MEKINKILNFIWKIIYKLIVLSIIFMCTIAIIQKSTDHKFSIVGIKFFTVITGSMIPIYNIGDIIVVKEVLPEEIKVDDDIVYKGEKGSYSNKMITHRVISIEQKEDGNYKIITKGVANRAKDPEINQTQVYGKVIFKIPIINFMLKIITNGYILIIIPVVILIKKNVRKIKKMEDA